MLQSFRGSASVHQSLHSSFGVGTSEGLASPGQLTGGCGVEGASSPSGPFSPIVHRSWDCGQLGEVGSPAVYSSSISA